MCHIFARITGAWKESEGKMILSSFLFYPETIVIFSSLSLRTQHPIGCGIFLEVTHCDLTQDLTLNLYRLTLVLFFGL